MSIKKDIILNRVFLFKNCYVFKKVYIKINAYINKNNIGNKSSLLHKIIFTNIKIWLNLKRDVDKGIYLGTFEFNNTFIFSNLIKKDSVILDIGANIGLYTLLAAYKLQNTGKIYSFEPSKVAIGELKKNIENNKFSNITTFEVALADTNGEKVFYRCEDDAYNSLNAITMQEVVSKEIVNTITLDEFARSNKLEKIDIIKIDAEGMDFDILKGARFILEKFRPIIFCEINEFYLDESLKENFINYLEKHNYELLIAKNYKIFLQLKKLDVSKDHNSEIICFPKSK